MAWLVSLTAALVVTATACAGCVGTARGYARAYPVGYAEVYSGPIPVGIYGTLYTYYDGRPVYWYDGRWMYRTGDRWHYYVTEPPALYRYRTTVRQAPPAPRYEPGYGPRPTYQQPAPSPAPPGRRVR
jgi:hypothetical protein